MINDEHGHIAGDKALIKIAKTIYKAMGKYGYCYRIGGDEFCVILKKDSLAKMSDATENYDAYQSITKLIDDFNFSVEKGSFILVRKSAYIELYSFY